MGWGRRSSRCPSRHGPRDARGARAIGAAAFVVAATPALRRAVGCGDDSAVSPERPSVPRQPDLFDGRGKDDVVPEPGRSSRPLPAAPATLAEAGPSELGAICSEIGARSLERAVPALEALWRRFVGFGIERPLAEQLAVLAALARLDRPAAGDSLLRELARSPSEALVDALADEATW